MSSMRNAVQRRNHRERGQLAGREKWGILEKHKDYSLRAKDYNLKKQKLSILSQKAKDRNPDEFAFGMLSADKSKQGKHGQNSLENRLDHDTVALLKTQDAGYLRTVGQKSKRELEELEREIKLSEVVGKASDEQVEEEAEETDGDQETASKTRPLSKKIKYIDYNDQPQEEIPSTYPTTADKDLTALSSDTEETQMPKSSTSQSTLRALRKKRKRLQEIRAAKLQALKIRQREIMKAADALGLQRARMAKVVGGVNKDGVKWKRRERKR